MWTAEDLSFGFDRVADDSAVAPIATQSHGVNGTFKAVEDAYASSKSELERSFAIHAAHLTLLDRILLHLGGEGSHSLVEVCHRVSHRSRHARRTHRPT